MDEYGCMKPCKEDAEQIRTALEQCTSVVFPLSGDSIGCMIVFICTKFDKIGTMPFGGNPIGRAYVGIHGRGCNHFSMSETHPSYFQEKLGLAQEEAEWFSDFWGLLWSPHE